MRNSKAIIKTFKAKIQKFFLFLVKFLEKLNDKQLQGYIEK